MGYRIRAETRQAERQRTALIRQKEDEGGGGRKVTLSFSSEEPYLRWYGNEILDHNPGAVDLTRLNEIGCLLYNHDRDAVIGKILRAWIEDGRGKAEVEFDPDPDSDLIFQKVQRGTLRGVSVGYRVDSTEEVAPGKLSADGRFQGPCEVARKWTPLEISIVSVPADSTVGVGRSLEQQEEEQRMDLERQTAPEETGAGAVNPVSETRGAVPDAGAGAQGGACAADIAEAIERARTEETARVREITGMCGALGMDPSEYIRSGATLDQVRAAVVERLVKERAPVQTRGTDTDLQGDLSRVRVADTGEDAFRCDAADGLLMRGGVAVDNPSRGAEQFTHLTLRDLAIECMEREGVAGARRMPADDLLQDVCTRQYFNPTSAFPAILDNAIEKAYVQGHRTAAVTFDQWTRKGALKDFKIHDNYYIAGPVGEFLEVPEGGELKNDIPTDAKRPQRRLRTYGKQFTLTRQAFINDDISLVTSIPARYAQAARKTINTQCYKILLDNPTIYDGKQLFHEDHGNELTTGTKITQAAMQSMIMALSTQTDEFGQPTIIRPAALLLPAGMQFDMYTLFFSPVIETENNTQAVNPLFRYKDTIVPIEDPTINALAGGFGKTMPWFLVGAASDTDFIEVDYLNGQEIPTIRRMETPGQLGFVWDIYLDWGITVMDWRGAVKNKGVAIESPLGT